MKVLLTVTAALLLAVGPAAAQRARSPADATVFIRLSGSVHADIIDDVGFRRSLDFDQVEIGSGSGFVISPYGYVLTNEHVVGNSEQFTVTRGLQQAKVTLKVSRVDVCFRPEAAAAHALPSPCTAASVAASDPALDLAVLFVNGSNLPYIALGDSDAVTAGVPVDVLGYPFGREVEVGKIATAPDLVPDVSTTPGAVSALRADDTGARRYLQITNSVNPGNSGGPLVTRDGFAVGVIRMRLTNAAGIGFAIPINEVKDFLESHGLDQLVPTRRLRLGSFQSIEAKQIGLRLPDGFADISPYRARVETDERIGGLALRIDRVFSPWSPRQIEASLIGAEAFEPIAMTARETRVPPPAGVTPLLPGGALGTATGTNQEVRMDYAILDLGSEKLVARYVGPAEAMAFNESVLRASLMSLQGQRVVVGDPVAVERLEWTSLQPAVNGQGVVAMPGGWIVEPGRPSACPGLPQPDIAVAASPPHDLTVVLRAAVWQARDIAPDAAAMACSSSRGSTGAASYTTRATWLGVSYVVDGAFIRLAQDRVVQFEVLSRTEQNVLARALLAAWLAKTRQ